MTRKCNRLAIELHLSLQGFYAGLSMNVPDPITVPSGVPLARFAKMYYDCTEDEEEGIAIMQQRKERHDCTIEQFLGHHATMVNDFPDIEDATNVGDSTRAHVATTQFLKHYRDYIGLLHQFRSKPKTTDYFLDFPSAPVTSMSRQYFCFGHFNPTHDYSGAVREADQLEHILKSIDPRHTISFGSELAPVTQPYGSGTWMDSSYRGRLEFTRKMWDDFKNPPARADL